MKRVIVGLSGGVDSSVAAYLLKEQGYDVIGIFMKNWHDESVTKSNECPWIEDSNDALLIANQLGIPFQVIDLSEAYEKRIVNYMFEEYQNGRTPNPDVLCNKEIKFDVFLKYALELGADFVATGHYCIKKENSDGTASLFAGKDINKDQSYFLCQLSQNQLKKILFPIGNLTKSEVRNIALKNKFVTASKKDSQGLCFVGKISLPTFLQQKLAIKEGPIIEIPENLDQFGSYNKIPLVLDEIENLANPFMFDKKMGSQVGTHDGAHFFTVGQRKGLKVGGRPLPSFVIQIDTFKNVVYTGQAENHPGLNRRALKVQLNSINYLNDKYKLEIGVQSKYLFRIRYRQPLQKGIMILKNDGLYVMFDVKQKGIAPGQFCAWYNEELELIGSGIIS